MENNKDLICPDCDAAGHTVSLDILGVCELCGIAPYEFTGGHPEPKPFVAGDYDPDEAFDPEHDWTRKSNDIDRLG